jgi:hypothetical protein
MCAARLVNVSYPQRLRAAHVNLHGDRGNKYVAGMDRAGGDAAAMVRAGCGIIVLLVSRQRS